MLVNIAGTPELQLCNSAALCGQLATVLPAAARHSAGDSSSVRSALCHCQRPTSSGMHSACPCIILAADQHAVHAEAVPLLAMGSPGLCQPSRKVSRLWSAHPSRAACMSVAAGRGLPAMPEPATCRCSAGHHPAVHGAQMVNTDSVAASAGQRLITAIGKALPAMLEPAAHTATGLHDPAACVVQVL